MEIEELGIKGAWIARAPIHKDDRGYFREWFKAREIEIAMGRSFDVQQGNMSSSNKGVLRGIHYSLAKRGQGKWITSISGSVWDVVVDIRPSSPTYKKWIGTELNSNTGDALFISEGLGHGFISLEDNSTVVYLLTSNYSPSEEFAIHPLDSDLAIAWPIENPSLSLKDASAPTLREQLYSRNLGFEK
jgi:dTDP-4-dehydrorhamnose 3,5-epimerase